MPVCAIDRDCARPSSWRLDRWWWRGAKASCGWLAAIAYCIVAAWSPSSWRLDSYQYYYYYYDDDDYYYYYYYYTLPH